MSTHQPGERIAERYVLVERIGEGGMGVVFSARDEKLRRTVAIKVLSPARVGNKTAQARLKREARAAAAFDNPGIARVFDVGETPDGGAFLVMELVRGQSVRPLKPPALTRPEALRILREVARTLDAAHKADLVHRDVKPDNIMIREDGRVVLLDFGIAKEVNQAPRKSTDDDVDSVVTAAGTMLGSPPYVAPEQIHGKGVGPASDQFALAVVAFGFLTGKKPWDSPTELGMLGQILMEPPMVATTLAPTLPKAVDEVFARGLAKEAAKRFPSVEAFVDALEGAVTGVRASAAPPETMAGYVAPPLAPPPVPEKTERASLASVPAPASLPPPEFQRPVWKIRVSEEPPPRDMSRIFLGAGIVAAVVLVILAVIGGVWYGRHDPPAPAGTSGDAAPRP